jgi:hypothetical protein
MWRLTGLAPMAHPRDKGTEHQDRGAHGPDQVVGGLAVGDSAGVDPNSLFSFYFRTKAFEEFSDGPDVHQIRHIVKGVPPFYQKRGGKDWKCGILGAADPNLTLKPLPPRDYDLVHRSSFAPAPAPAVVFFAATTRSRPP